MKNFNELQKFSLNKMNQIYGGIEPRETEIPDNEGNVLYTDVHNDNDNDGKWSCGDTFVLTKA